MTWERTWIVNDMGAYLNYQWNGSVPGLSMAREPGLEIRGILVANATMFSHLLPGFSCGSKHLLLP